MLNFYPRLCTLNPFRSGSEVGYHVTEPCRSCLKACNNGHFWMYVPTRAQTQSQLFLHSIFSHVHLPLSTSTRLCPPLTAQTACHPRSCARSLARDFTQRRGANERALVGCCLAARRFHGTEVIARERVSFSSELRPDPPPPVTRRSTYTSLLPQSWRPEPACIASPRSHVAILSSCGRWRCAWHHHRREQHPLAEGSLAKVCV